MKKIIVLFLLLFLSSCFGNKKEEDKTLNSAGLGTGVVNLSGKVNTGSINTGNIEEEKNRLDIKIEDVDNLFFNSSNISEEKLNGNPVLKNGLNFINGLKEVYDIKLTEHINGGIDFSDYEKMIEKSNQKYIRNMDLELEIKDYKTKEKIKSGKVYLNNIKFGEFKDGIFKKEYKWPMGIERFTIMVRADGYGDGFLDLNSLYIDSDFSFGEILLKKSIEKEVSLDKNEGIEIGGIEKNNFKLELPKCSLVDKEGKCYRGKAKVKSNYVSGEEVNGGTVSLNMRAIRKDNGKYTYLYSGGMAFNDFITENGEILKLGKGKKIKVTYKLSEGGFLHFGDINSYPGNTRKGYWWYDKDNMIWKEGNSKITIDLDKKLWIAEIEDIY